MIRMMAIGGALALAACAGRSKQVKDGPKEESQLICTYEPAIGSNIPDKVCREPEDQPEPAKGGAQSRSSTQSGK